MESSVEIPKKDIAIPQVALNINLPPEVTNDFALVKQEEIVGLCKNIMEDINTEKNEIQEAYVNFAEMVFNAGDATSASKEALVNLLKLKSDLIDKKSRMMEVMMKAYNKEGPKNITAHQHNDFHVHDKRKLFADLDKKEIVKEKNEKNA